MSDKEELDRLPRNLKILALHRKKVTRAEHEKKKDLVKSWISEQNFKDRFVKNQLHLYISHHNYHLHYLGHHYHGQHCQQYNHCH